MKTFNRSSLPESIIYNGKIYKCNASESSLMAQSINISSYLIALKRNGINAIIVNVLSKNLKGKTDLHGQPYKPSQWIYTSI